MPSSREDICSVGDSRLSTLAVELQKNRKLNWMMIVAATQKSHCVEQTGIMALKCDKQLASHIMACQYAWLWRSFHGSYAASLGGRPAATSGPLASSRVSNAPWFFRTHCPNRISPSHRIPLFWPLSKTQPSGLPRAANLHYSLQATFTTRTVQLYFQAH